MTIELTARVLRARYYNAWFAHVYATNSETGEVIAIRSSDPQHSHPEAMQAAYKMLADLDAQLMDEVHQSRGSRHAAKNDRLKAETIA